MEMRTLKPYLVEHPFFEGLAPEYINLLVGCAKNMSAGPGSYVFKQGESAEHFYLIRHGQIAIDVPTPTGGRITIETLQEGDVFGWSWLYPPFTWQFDARVVELTRTLMLGGECVRKKCEDDPRLGYDLMKRFSAVMQDRLQATRMQLLDLYGNSEAKATW